MTTNNLCGSCALYRRAVNPCTGRVGTEDSHYMYPIFRDDDYSGQSIEPRFLSEVGTSECLNYEPSHPGFLLIIEGEPGGPLYFSSREALDTYLSSVHHHWAGDVYDLATAQCGSPLKEELVWGKA